MIESEKFKKMLSILKTNSKDLNVTVCIIDYETKVECDYEVITLYLKETNTQNGASVNKKLIIRSQLYYNEDDDKYYSALDADIISESRKPTKINILTDVAEELLQDEQINIKIQLLDVETREPIRNQSVFMYLSGAPDESIGSALTNKNGEALFNFYLKDYMVLLSQEQLLYFEYLGNNIYNKSKSNYIILNINDTTDKELESELTACIRPDSTIRIKYDISFDGTNLVDGFKQYTSLDIPDADLIAGKVLFYINTPSQQKFLGERHLVQDNDKTISVLSVPLSYEYANRDIDIQVIFEGNTFFSSNSAIIPIRFNKSLVNESELIVNRINNGFETQLTFSVNTVETPLCDAGLDTMYYALGEVKFYLKNSNDDWGTLDDAAPFYTTTHITGTKEDDVYYFATEKDVITINKEDYGLESDSPLSIKAVFSGNAVIESFMKYYEEE